VNKRWRVGIVGSGFGAAVHLPAFRAQGAFDVVALASPNRAESIAKEQAVPHSFALLSEMLDGVELDVVSIATPPYDHLPAVIACLERGKNVLCEKPFALSVAEAEQMQDAALRARTVCAIAHEFRYTPSRLAMHELIDNGHLGALREIEYTVFYKMLRAHVERRNNWWFRKERGGGLAGAILSHMADTVSWLAGRPPVRSVGLARTANVQRTFEGERFESDVDDGAFALVDYGNGLVGRITVDGTRAVESATLAAHGEKMSTVASGSSILDAKMFTIDEDETSELELQPDPHVKLAKTHPNLPPFVNLLDEFAKALDGKPADLPTFEDGVNTQRVLEAVGFGVESERKV
jgi:predicted dehydrogenase